MPKDLSGLMSTITKKLKGSVKIQRVADVVTPYHIKYRTGIMSLDIALNGGFPAGTIVQLWGHKGVGKDYLSNLMLAAAQQDYGDEANLFWTSFGYKPDKPFMEMCGVVLEGLGNLWFVDVDKKGEVHPSEAMLSAALDIVKSNEFQIGVINELGSGETKENVKKKLHEEAKVATWASLMSDFCRKYYSVMRVVVEGVPNKTLIVMINPVRANMDSKTSRWQKHIQTSGEALQHAKAIDVELKHQKWIKEGEGEEAKKIGKVIKWRVIKGKHGISEGAEGSFSFYHGLGVDLEEDLVNVGRSYGLITAAGAWFSVPWSDKTIQGMAKVKASLRANPEARAELETAIWEKVRA